MTDKEFFKTMRHEAKEYSDIFHEAFPNWVLQVFNPVLSYEDIRDAVDGLDHDDDSIDAFWIDEDKREINIVQCKSAKSERNLIACKKEWLSYLYDTINKLENVEYIDEHRNTRIQEIAAEFVEARGKNYIIHFFFFQLGYLPINNQNLLNSYNNDPSIIFEYFGFSDIRSQWDEYKSRISLTEPRFFEFKIYSNNEEYNIIRNKVGNYSTLIGLISGSQLIKLRQEHKYKLFDMNVRFNLGKNKINTEIINTATGEPLNFYYYNNGITITCNSFKYKEVTKLIRVDYPQIINGAQTVDSLYSAYTQKLNKMTRRLGDSEEAIRRVDKEFDKIKVMFRIIQSDSHNSPFALKVIRFNNSQNSIQIRDFYANRPEQIELQKKLAEYGYFYEIKRGERNYVKNEEHILLKKKLSDFQYSNQKMNIENVCSSYRAFLGEPSAKEVGAKYILNNDNVYLELFGGSPSDIDDIKIREIILAFNIFQLIEEEARVYNKILVLLPRTEKDASQFPKLVEAVRSSMIFNNVVKNKFQDIEGYYEDKESINSKLRESFPFTQGKYQILALFHVILKKCNYLPSIYQYHLHYNLEFLKTQLIKNWLPVCLDNILVPIYKKTTKTESISMNAFYLRTSTFENLKNKFRRLDMDLNKEYKDLFPINFNEL